MCGITGLVGDFSKESLSLMTNSIAHRGPDGDGLWFSEDERVGLGHRRLAIIDLSSAARQPMHSVDSRYVVVFNGEIYNFTELASLLEQKGYVFNRNSDTAILAPLFDLYGHRMLHKLSGIFAFAIWDKREKTLFVARDHLGIKPFYYSKSHRGFAFASELKALLYIDGIDRTLDTQALFSYITYLWCPGRPTLLRGVHKLLPGHFMFLRQGKLTIGQWYEPPLPRVQGGRPIYDSSKTAGDLLQLLDEVIDEQQISDVPIGSFLSGGVDSSAIVSSICRHEDKAIDVFCMKFEGASMKDEGFSEDIEYARQVASRHNVFLHEVSVDETSLGGLADMVFYLDEPQADPSPLYVRLISRAARDMGVKVLMSGTGGDDVFTGYRRHQVMNMMHNTRFIPKPLQRAVLYLLSCASQGPTKRRLQKLVYVSQNSIEDALLRAYHFTTPNVLLEVLSPELRQQFLVHTSDHLEDLLDRTYAQHPVNQQLFLEAHGFLPDHNLNYTDKLSMAEGIEIRVPFLDPKILNFAADLPIPEKIRRGETKYILRKALEDRLPRQVLYRSKAGFGAPMRQWLIGPARQSVEDLLFSSSQNSRGLFDTDAVRRVMADTVSGRKDGAYTILSLMVIELWFRQFIDHKTPTRIASWEEHLG